MLRLSKKDFETDSGWLVKPKLESENHTDEKQCLYDQWLGLADLVDKFDPFSTFSIDQEPNQQNETNVEDQYVSESELTLVFNLKFW